MDKDKKSRAMENMESFWELKGEEVVRKYEERLKIDDSNYLSHGVKIKSIDKTPSYQLLADQLNDCHYIIITANSVESQTVKQLLYEEARDRKIYKFWMKHVLGEIPLDKNDPWDSADEEIKDREHSDNVRSPKLLEINFESEAQYYFVTLGATEDEIEVDPSKRRIKVAYICPQNTSSFTGNGSHKAVVHAIRRYRDSNIDFYPFIVSLGVSFGLNPAKCTKEREFSERQLLGDVLISKSIIAYDAKYKVDDERGIQFSKCEMYNLEQGANRAFAGRFDRNRHFLVSSKLAQKEAEKQGMDIYCHFGALYSGGAVVSSAEFKKKLIDSSFDNGDKTYSEEINPIGGEMEGVGIWYACLLEDDLFPCVVIKGICDWGEEKNAWERVLEEKAPTFLNSKIREKLRERLSGFILRDILDLDLSDELFTKIYEILCERSTISVEEIKEVFQLKEVLEETVDDEEINSEANRLRNKVLECFDSAKKAVNDLIKDSIQSYATERAFKVFCYMLYDDPQLAIVPARSPIESNNLKEKKELSAQRDSLLQENEHVRNELFRREKQTDDLLENLNKRIEDDEKYRIIEERYSSLEAQYRELQKVQKLQEEIIRRYANSKDK